MREYVTTMAIEQYFNKAFPGFYHRSRFEGQTIPHFSPVDLGNLQPGDFRELEDVPFLTEQPEQLALRTVTPELASSAQQAVQRYAKDNGRTPETMNDQWRIRAIDERYLYRHPALQPLLSSAFIAHPLTAISEDADVKDPRFWFDLQTWTGVTRGHGTLSQET